MSFYCSNFWIFLFLFGADFFCRKERCFRPILYRPFLYRPILRADSTKNSARTAPIKHAVLFCAIRPHERAPHTPHLYSAALFGTHRPPKGPRFGTPPTAKTTLLGPCTANLVLFTHTKIPNAKAQRTPKRPKCPNAKTRGRSRRPTKIPQRKKPRE